MPASTTLADLIVEIRDRADIEKQFRRYPDAELTRYINKSYKKLYGLLVNALLIRPEKNQTITTDGSSYYSLATDHFATLTVWWNHTNDNFIRCFRHLETDRPFGLSTEQSNSHGRYTYRAAEFGGTRSIEFCPVSSGETFIVSYVPEPTDFETDVDSISTFLGWDEFIILDVAIKVLAKEQSNPGNFPEELYAIHKRIEDEAELVEMTQSIQMTDVRKHSEFLDPASVKWYKPYHLF